jgi:hypothetical protein
LAKDAMRQLDEASMLPCVGGLSSGNVSEEGLRGLARAAEDNLALGALSQEWAHHLVCCKVPPRHIDEHLQWINDPTKSNFPHTEDYPTPEWHS